MTEGNLSGRIAYDAEDEFKPVCDSFDLMQEHLQKELEKKTGHMRKPERRWSVGFPMTFGLR